MKRHIVAGLVPLPAQAAFAAQPVVAGAAGAMQAIPDAQREAFRQRLEDVMRDPGAQATLCASVRGFGAPAYYPACMVDHGPGAMQAAMSGQPVANGGLRQDFDAAKGWDAAVAGYLQCSRDSR
ncbi:hypothetical protein [Paraburkholderia kururiensis]|uniref:hypothetical protein n=1 Tax=Paraburkholderia kururiensis TaxID=984307 RepID=UPI000F867B9F|nr:hypothetical protein [Paraburkholderia kururiensis]